MRKGEGTIPMHCCTISFQDYPHRWRVTFPCNLSIKFNCMDGRARTYVWPTKLSTPYEREVIHPYYLYSFIPSPISIMFLYLITKTHFNNILLKEEDLHFRSYLRSTLLTVEPICLHQSISTLFSSRILQRFSCGRNWSRTNSFGFSVQRFYRVSFSSFICFNVAKI